MPVGCALIAWRLMRGAAPSWRGRALAAVLVAAAAGVILSPLAGQTAVFRGALALLLVAAVFGAPVFAILGGLAILLFRHADVPLAAIPTEIYRLVTSPALPTIPLFAFAGYLLAAGKASHRLLRFFRALFGWMPGAIAVVTVLACTFFTTFTGASGVTIVALGGLLLPALKAEGYTDRFSIGLLTSTGALGLLFPPASRSSSTASWPASRSTSCFSAGSSRDSCSSCWFWRSPCARVPRGQARGHPSPWPNWAARSREAKWEILLPVLVVLGIFGGFATMVETAALAVLYVLFVEVFVHRDISLRDDFPRIGAEAATLIGGVLIVMAAAMGLTSYLVDAGVPGKSFRGRGRRSTPAWSSWSSSMSCC